MLHAPHAEPLGAFDLSAVATTRMTDPSSAAPASHPTDSPETFAMPAATVRSVAPSDLPAITELHDRVFGPGALTRSAYRVREAAPPFSRFCRTSRVDGRLLAAVRLTEITIGDKPGALLLGPLAVDPAVAGQGYGKALVAAALEAARAGGIRLVVLVGNMPYYGRFGFAPVPPGQIQLPGPVDPARILAAELVAGALAEYRGLIRAVPGVGVRPCGSDPA